MSSHCSKCKSNLVCDVCGVKICKYCAQLLDENNFSFLPTIPTILSHQTYCEDCFDKNVRSELQNYNDCLELAKNITVYEKSQGKETRLMKRLEKPVKVIDCQDKEETLLRLAFYAVQKGHNALLDVDIKCEKVRSGAYQTSKWSGTAVPATINERQVVKDRSIWQNPN